MEPSALLVLPTPERPAGLEGRTVVIFMILAAVVVVLVIVGMPVIGLDSRAG